MLRKMYEKWAAGHHDLGVETGPFVPPSLPPFFPPCLPFAPYSSCLPLSPSAVPPRDLICEIHFVMALPLRPPSPPPSLPPHPFPSLPIPFPPSPSLSTVHETWGENGGGLRSVLLLLKGPLAYGWSKTEAGVHRLVRISPFDTAQRRHTTFAQVRYRLLPFPSPFPRWRVAASADGGGGSKEKEGMDETRCLPPSCPPHLLLLLLQFLILPLRLLLSPSFSLLSFYSLFHPSFPPVLTFLPSLPRSEFTPPPFPPPPPPPRRLQPSTSIPKT